MLVLVLTATSVAASTGALRCACCAPTRAASVEADLCCPGDDGARCVSVALEPPSASLWVAIAEASRPAIAPLAVVPARVSVAWLELHADGARPSGREGLAMRSILRL